MSEPVETVVATKMRFNQRLDVGEVLDCIAALFSGSNANESFNTCDPYLSVSNFSSISCSAYCSNHIVDVVVFNDELKAYLGYELDGVFGTALWFAVSSLTTKATYFRHGHPLDADCLQCVFHVVKLEWLHDCGDEFHCVPFS